MKVNADSYCGSGGYGKKEVTFGGVRFSLATLMSHFPQSRVLLVCGIAIS